MTCKDCLYAKVCDNLIAHGLPFEDGKYPAEKFCDLYKSSADVVEVVHARWIDHKNGNATCSHCRIRQTAVYDDENEQNFCGHCGAKMDGERKEATP